MSAPEQSPPQLPPAQNGTTWKFWAWFGVVAVLFLVYLFGGAWLSQRYGFGTDINTWWDRWGNWVWLALVIGGAVSAASALIRRNAEGDRGQ